jgi:hypothetical protein
VKQVDRFVTFRQPSVKSDTLQWMREDAIQQLMVLMLGVLESKFFAGCRLGAAQAHVATMMEQMELCRLSQETTS